MNFLKKLFGGQTAASSPTGQSNDPQGIYLYAQCDHCGTVVRVRADKQHDLNSVDGGFVWHKTIVDSKCFRRMSAVVHFDRSYNITNSELEGGQFVSAEAYD